MTSEVLTKQRRALQKEGLDALIAVSPENVGYTAGYMIPSQVIPIRKRQFFAVVTPEEEALVVVDVEYNEAVASSRIKDIRQYNQFTENPVDLLAATLRELGVAKGRVGIELDFMPARSHLRLCKALPKLELVDAEHIYDDLRMIKTQDELEIIRRIAGIVDETHAEVYQRAEPGMTEMDIAFMFIEGILARGADEMRKLVVGSGERSVYANCVPTHRVLQPGDVMRVDVFASLNGYLSDIARTSVVGEATPRQKEIWGKLCDAETLVFEHLRPGTTTGQVWRAFLDFFTKADLDPAINFLGHSIGLTLHEQPYIDRYRDYPIEEGMVLVIEPVFFTGNQGFHLEDIVLVTAGGCEILSDGRGDLPIIG